MNKTIEKSSNEQPQEMRNELNTKTSYAFKEIHSMVILGILHLLYIVFEAINAFNEAWISTIFYSIICIASIVYIAFQWELANYLLPIPFVSLIVVSGINELTISSTVIYFVYCVFYFTMVMLKKDAITTIILLTSSAFTFLLMTVFSYFGQGFVIINSELTVVNFLLPAWVAAASVVVVQNRENMGVVIAYNITTILLGATLPFCAGFAFVNTFCIMSALTVVLGSGISLVIALREEDQSFTNFLVMALISQIGLVVLSYSFVFNFTLTTLFNSVIIVDYAFHLPLVLFVTINLGVQYYDKSPENLPKKDRENRETILIASFTTAILSAMMMFGWTAGNVNLIKALVFSILYLSVALALQYPISSTITMLSTYISLGLMLGLVANVEMGLINIILMSFSGAILIVAIINDLFLAGEPLTSILTFTGSLVLMVNFFLYFEYLSLWISMGWAILGLYLFCFGVFMEKIIARRTGLSIILIDIVYSIIALIVEYGASLEMGIGFAVLAIVLFSCIFLFRWSEKKYRQEHQEKEVIEG